MAGPVRGMYGIVQLHTSGRYKIQNGTKVGTVHTPRSGQYKSQDGIYVGTVHHLVHCTAHATTKIPVTYILFRQQDAATFMFTACTLFYCNLCQF